MSKKKRTENETKRLDLCKQQLSKSIFDLLVTFVIALFARRAVLALPLTYLLSQPDQLQGWDVFAEV